MEAMPAIQPRSLRVLFRLGKNTLDFMIKHHYRLIFFSETGPVFFLLFSKDVFLRGATSMVWYQWHTQTAITFVLSIALESVTTPNLCRTNLDEEILVPICLNRWIATSSLEQRQTVPANMNLADPLAEVIAPEAKNDANVTCLLQHSQNSQCF